MNYNNKLYYIVPRTRVRIKANDNCTMKRAAIVTIFFFFYWIKPLAAVEQRGTTMTRDRIIILGTQI